MAVALRSQLVHLQRKCLRQFELRPLVLATRRSEVVLQVGVVDVLITADQTAGLEVVRSGEAAAG